jgi:hypothetical protein
MTSKLGAFARHEAKAEQAHAEQGEGSWLPYSLQALAIGQVEVAPRGDAYRDLLSLVE